MKKRYFAAAGALFMAAALFGQNAADFEYEAGDEEVTIIYYTGSEKNVTIPERINNLPVTAIGDSAFRENQLTGVTIPDSVTVIGARAFEGNWLTGIAIPNSVTVIGDYAFYHNQLTRVTVPANVDMSVSSFNSLLYVLYAANDRKAAVYAFSRSTDGDFDSTVCNNTVEIAGYRGKAAELALPEKINGLPVVAIGARVFAFNQLTGVIIPGSVTVIGDHAFYHNQLTGVIIPNSVTAIGDYAFAENRLTAVTIPNSVTVIGNWAFAENQLTSVIIPDSVTTIGAVAFTANRLTSVIIPDSVTTIGVEAFAANQLTSVTIPDSVTIIGNWAFTDNRLTSVTIPSNVNVAGSSFDGNLADVYTSEGRRAGTYRSSDGGETWTRQ